MQATLTWLDLTASDRDKMRRVLDLFKEQGHARRDGAREPAGRALGRAVSGHVVHPDPAAVRPVRPVALSAVGGSESWGRRGAASRSAGGSRSHRSARAEPGPGGHHRPEGARRARTAAEFRLLGRAHAVGHLSAAAEPGLVPVALRRARGRPRRRGAGGRSGRDLEPAGALASAAAGAAEGVSLGSVVRVDSWTRPTSCAAAWRSGARALCWRGWCGTDRIRRRRSSGTIRMRCAPRSLSARRWSWRGGSRSTSRACRCSTTCSWPKRRRDVLDTDEAESIEACRAALAEWAAEEADEDRPFEPDALWELVVRRGGRLPYPQRVFIESWSRRLGALGPTRSPTTPGCGHRSPNASGASRARGHGCGAGTACWTGRRRGLAPVGGAAGWTSAGFACGSS